ncbi:hypothetical protein ACLM5H_08990 [Fredinandcohnia humi]
MKKSIMNLVGYTSIFILLLSGCNKDQVFINAETEIHSITAEEFEVIGVGDIENPNIDDFKRLKVNLEIENVENLQSHEITTPNFRQIINSIDNNHERYWFGNESKESTKYTLEMVFFARGLEEEDIRNAFKEEYITVILEKEDFRNIKRINVSEKLEFK